MSDTAMPKEIFTVKYDGQSLLNHEMDVAVLAPALMSLGKLIRALSQDVSNGEYTATLSVRGNIKAGSVEVELVTQMSLAQQIIGIFTSSAFTAVANFGGIVGLIGLVIGLIRKYKGSMPTKSVPKGGDIEMHFGDHVEIVNIYVYHTYTNHELRTHIYETLKPLERDGIDTFSIKDSQGETISQVDDDELHYFNPNAVVRPLGEDVRVTTLVIESLTFKEKNKWSFNDGVNTIKATISDDRFLTEIENGKRFAKGDWLKVKLKTTQTEEAGKLKSTHEIIEVLEHIVREQYRLNI